MSFSDVVFDRIRRWLRVWCGVGIWGCAGRSRWLGRGRRVRRWVRCRMGHWYRLGEHVHQPTLCVCRNDEIDRARGEKIKRRDKVTHARTYPSSFHSSAHIATEPKAALREGANLGQPVFTCQKIELANIRLDTRMTRSVSQSTTQRCSFRVAF